MNSIFTEIKITSVEENMKFIERNSSFTRPRPRHISAIDAMSNKIREKVAHYWGDARQDKKNNIIVVRFDSLDNCFNFVTDLWSNVDFNLEIETDESRREAIIRVN